MSDNRLISTKLSDNNLAGDWWKQEFFKPITNQEFVILVITIIIMMMVIMIMMIMITNGPHSQSWDTWLTNCPGYRKKKEKRSKQSKAKIKTKRQSKKLFSNNNNKKRT